MPGKEDWLASDLPYEGHALLAGRAVDRDVPTCRTDQRLGEVRDRLPRERAPWITCNEVGVVMGTLDPDEVTGSGDDVRVEEVMSFGTTTVRPSEELSALLERMHGAGVESIVVTRPDGTLVGLLERDRGDELVAAES